MYDRARERVKNDSKLVLRQRYKKKNLRRRKGYTDFFFVLTLSS